MNLVLQANKTIYLIIIGSDQSENYLKRLYVSENVAFLGTMPHHAIYSYYKNVDALIMPSKSETLGLTILEAMYYECPVISIKSEATANIIRNGINGMLYEPDNADDLIRQVQQFLCLSKDILSYQVKNAKEFVNAMTWVNATLQLLSYYVDL